MARLNRAYDIAIGLERDPAVRRFLQRRQADCRTLACDTLEVVFGLCLFITARSKSYIEACLQTRRHCGLLAIAWIVGCSGSVGDGQGPAESGGSSGQATGGASGAPANGVGGASAAGSGGAGTGAGGARRGRLAAP